VTQYYIKVGLKYCSIKDYAKCYCFVSVKLCKQITAAVFLRGPVNFFRDLFWVWLAIGSTWFFPYSFCWTGYWCQLWFVFKMQRQEHGL